MRDRRADLDGIRAVAVLAVFASHSPIGHAAGGWLGVDVFFVLSGYLITSLLLEEYRRTGTVSFGRFYARRALRLYPALLVALLLVTLAWPLYPHLGSYTRTALPALFYVTDFVNGFSYPLGPLTHTWSLAIEEQFYLVWPPVLAWFLGRRRAVTPWLVVAILAGWAGAAAGAFGANPSGTPATYFLPWTRFPQLLVGCIVALVLATRLLPRWIALRGVGWLVVLALAALWYDAGRQPRIPHFAWQAPAVALLTGALLLHLDHAAGGVRACLAWRPLVALGLRSYGFYLFHFPVFLVVDDHVTGKLTALVVAFAVTLAVTWASYRFVELPFLRRKRRFEVTTHLAEAPGP